VQPFRLTNALHAVLYMDTASTGLVITIEGIW
jgi:hypothetical protein